MSFTRQLSEMSASELNDAIDDTNFPQSHILSRGRNNSVCSTSSTSGTSSLADRVVPAADEAAAGSTTPASVGVEEVAQPTRPRLILKSSASIPENDGTQPITPMTPRTTTTPGSGAPSGGELNYPPFTPTYVCVCVQLIVLRRL